LLFVVVVVVVVVGGGGGGGGGGCRWWRFYKKIVEWPNILRVVAGLLKYYCTVASSSKYEY